MCGSSLKGVVERARTDEQAGGIDVNKGIISVLGGILLFGALVLWAADTAVFVLPVCHGLFPGLCTDSSSPFYPLVIEPIGQVWGWEAAPFVTMYGAILAFTLGVAVCLIATNRTRRPAHTVSLRMPGWQVQLIGLVLGVVVANVSGAVEFQRTALLPVARYCRPEWCPPVPLFVPPVWQWVCTYPKLSLALVVLSVLLALLGVLFTGRMRGGQRVWLTRGLQLLPVVTVTLTGLAALFLFPLPYSL
jgi:hypothetical protein